MIGLIVHLSPRMRSHFSAVWKNNQRFVSPSIRRPTMKEHPEHRAEAKQDLQLLNAQKMGEHEAEIEKIKNVFLAILRDIKKDIDNGEQPGEAVTAAMFQAMRDALAEQKQKPLSIDDVTAMIAGQIGQLAPMDEETADLFQRLVKKMIEQAEK